MIIHQIYWDFKGKGNPMPSLYKEKQQKVKEWCKNGYGVKNEYTYKLWNEEMVDELVSSVYPQFQEFISLVKYPIMKVDIVKWLILHNEGGLYLDLDIEPKIQSLKPYVFALASSASSKYNVDVIQGIKGNTILLEFVKHIQLEVAEKDKIEIYKTWKFRYVLQTTGPSSLNRFIKQNKLKPNIYNTNDATTNPPCMNMTGYEDFIDHPSAVWASTL